MPGMEDQERHSRDTGQSELSLYLLARALGEALTANQVASATFDHALRQLGAVTAGLWLRGEDDVIRMSACVGPDAEQWAEAVGEIPMNSDLPAALVVRTGAIVSYSSIEERDARWPALRGVAGSPVVVVLPLSARARQFGCLHVGWPSAPQATFPPDSSVLSALAELCAGAVDRAQLYEAERRGRRTLEFLHQGTRLMVSALEPDEIVRALVRMAVPQLAPWCAVYVADGDQLERVAVEVSGEPELSELLMTSGPVPVEADVPLAEAYRTSRPLLLPEVRLEQVLGTYPVEHARLLLSLEGGRWSGMVVPVQAGGRAIGVMSLLSPEWNGAPPSEVRFAAEGLAGRAGMALHIARRYRAQVDNVALLSAALLPDRVPTLPGVRLAARYVPAGGGVCGDWYEAEQLPDGQVLVGIGDASGHGIPAAAMMAQVRNAARGLAVAGISPAHMLDHLSALVLRGQPECMVTVVYGVLDPDTGRGTWANAGHPPPVLVGADGSAATIALPPGPPIGTVDRPYAETALELPVGARLVLYTDGLFERRGEDPGLGIDRLVKQAAAGGGEDEIADTLMQSRPETTDDGCVLVIGR